MGKSVSESIETVLQSFPGFKIVPRTARHRYEIKGAVSRFSAGETGVDGKILDIKTGKTLALFSLTGSDAFQPALQKALKQAGLLP